MAKRTRRKNKNDVQIVRSPEAREAAAIESRRMIDEAYYYFTEGETRFGIAAAVDAAYAAGIAEGLGAIDPELGLEYAQESSQLILEHLGYRPIGVGETPPFEGFMEEQTRRAVGRMPAVSRYMRERGAPDFGEREPEPSEFPAPRRYNPAPRMNSVEVAELAIGQGDKSSDPGEMAFLAVFAAYHLGKTAMDDPRSTREGGAVSLLYPKAQDLACAAVAHAHDQGDRRARGRNPRPSRRTMSREVRRLRGRLTRL